MIKKVIFSERPELIHNEGETVMIAFGVTEVELIKEKDIADASSKSDKVLSAGDSDSNGGTEVTAEVEKTTSYEAYCVRMRHPLDRSSVIDAIVSAAYSHDEMEAINNNFLLDVSAGEVDEEHRREFDEMQAWRRTAKEVASEVVAKALGR